MRNITNITNINSLHTLGKYASDSTGGLFWGLILMGIFFIVTYNLRERGIDNAIMSSSFACFLISILLLNLEWVGLIYPVAFGLFLGGSAFYKVFNKSGASN